MLCVLFLDGRTSTCFYLLCDNFSGVYKHYDGIICPEIFNHSALGINPKPKKAGWFSFLRGKKENTASSGEQKFDIKLLFESDHVELRKIALKLYLIGLQNVFYGLGSIDESVDIVRQVFAIYASLNSSYVFCDYCERSWKFDETKEVCMYCKCSHSQQFLCLIGSIMYTYIYMYANVCIELLFIAGNVQVPRVYGRISYRSNYYSS